MKKIAAILGMVFALGACSGGLPGIGSLSLLTGGQSIPEAIKETVTGLLDPGPYATERTRFNVYLEKLERADLPVAAVQKEKIIAINSFLDVIDMMIEGGEPALVPIAHVRGMIDDLEETGVLAGLAAKTGASLIRLGIFEDE